MTIAPDLKIEAGIDFNGDGIICMNSFPYVPNLITYSKWAETIAKNRFSLHSSSNAGFINDLSSRVPDDLQMNPEMRHAVRYQTQINNANVSVIQVDIFKVGGSYTFPIQLTPTTYTANLFYTYRASRENANFYAEIRLMHTPDLSTVNIVSTTTVQLTNTSNWKRGSARLTFTAPATSQHYWFRIRIVRPAGTEAGSTIDFMLYNVGIFNGTMPQEYFNTGDVFDSRDNINPYIKNVDISSGIFDGRIARVGKLNLGLINLDNNLGNIFHPYYCINKRIVVDAVYGQTRTRLFTGFIKNIDMQTFSLNEWGITIEAEDILSDLVDKPFEMKLEPEETVASLLQAIDRTEKLSRIYRPCCVLDESKLDTDSILPPSQSAVKLQGLNIEINNAGVGFTADSQVYNVLEDLAEFCNGFVYCDPDGTLILNTNFIAGTPEVVGDTYTDDYDYAYAFLTDYEKQKMSSLAQTLAILRQKGKWHTLIYIVNNNLPGGGDANNEPIVETIINLSNISLVEDFKIILKSYTPFPEELAVNGSQIIGYFYVNDFQEIVREYGSKITLLEASPSNNPLLGINPNLPIGTPPSPVPGMVWGEDRGWNYYAVKSSVVNAATPNDVEVSRIINLDYSAGLENVVNDLETYYYPVIPEIGVTLLTPEEYVLGENQSLAVTEIINLDNYYGLKVTDVLQVGSGSLLTVTDSEGNGDYSAEVDVTINIVSSNKIGINIVNKSNEIRLVTLIVVGNREVIRDKGAITDSIRTSTASYSLRRKTIENYFIRNINEAVNVFWNNMKPSILPYFKSGQVIWASDNTTTDNFSSLFFRPMFEQAFITDFWRLGIWSVIFAKEFSWQDSVGKMTYYFRPRSLYAYLKLDVSVLNKTSFL